MKTGFFAAALAMGLAAVVSLTAFAGPGHDHGDHKHAELKVGADAPKFTLKDQTGKDVSLTDFSGKVVVLEWFNEGCPFVVKHYKNGDMNKLADAYKGKDVVWLRINSTAKATQESNAKIAADWKIDGPILLDADGEVGHDYGATNTPHMYIVNKDGVLAYKGAIDSNNSSKQADIAGSTNYVAQALDELVAGKAVSEPENKAYGCSVKYAKK
jgi:peroxiredoxin